MPTPVGWLRSEVEMTGEWDRRGRLFFDRHLWDVLTELDRIWLARHMQLVYDMAQLAGPRNPYQSARR